MGFESERATIEGYLNSNWTATPIKWPNVAFEPGTAAAFIEPWIIDGDSYQASLGNPAIERTPGILSINIRVRSGTGMAVSRTHVDSLAALFRRKYVSGVVFRSPRVAQVGDLDGWYVTNVSFQFIRDELFTVT